MTLQRRALALAVSAVLVAASAPADAGTLLARFDFEEPGGGAPAGWRVVAPPGSAVERDWRVARSGAASLKVTSVTPAEVTVESTEIALSVGRLYRLSGWIRTAGALADPTARYPTALPACLAMASFPFTNHSPAVGGDSDWTQVEEVFVATRAQDRLRLHLGFNGTATGTAWFDDLRVEEVTNIDDFLALEAVRWQGEGYRFEHRGWIFVHIEGEPYQRGFQHGALLADEIVEYARKLSVQQNEKDPAAGWATLRFQADALLLRGFDAEQLTEMRGIADGAAHKGATLHGKKVDFLDVVTLNSVIDLGQMASALRVTPHALSGQSFAFPLEELKIPETVHRCSSFAATGPATASGEVVFGQIFMWGGYTGVHWNVLLDIEPSSGHRLVMQTFPGGIHSGADFYINDAGLVIGETTVAQTPFDPTGTPQSSRIRRAAQYASSIDQVAAILRERNNGMYTNDWPIADVKTGEVAILLLGTRASRLWRSGDAEAPFGTPGFLWSNNNARDPAVRREYAVQADDAPFDVAFAPTNRDVAFWRFWEEFRGRIDEQAAVRLWASSPVNRPHACDGKITTTAMARELVFLAHHGKVTLREKFPEKGNRRMPDLPGAVPHLALGYATASPGVITEMLKSARTDRLAKAGVGAPPPAGRVDLGAMAGRYSVDQRKLWKGTVFPAATGDQWLTSGSAAYWRLLQELPAAAEEGYRQLADRLAELNARYLTLVASEGERPARAAGVAYDRYAPYHLPRLKGTFALHQLRLLLGNATFLEVMREAHARFAGREMGAAEFVALAEEIARRPLAPFLAQWSERTGLPDPAVAVRGGKVKEGWRLEITVTQAGEPYHFLTAVAVEARGVAALRPLEVQGARTEVSWALPSRPDRVIFNPTFDIPVPLANPYTWASFLDRFEDTLIVHGTSRQEEANHTLALRLQTTLADAYTEVLVPVVKDCELSQAAAAAHDLIVLGSPQDNSFTARLRQHLPVVLKNGAFSFLGGSYAHPDDGLFLAVPNPFNPARVVYLFLANSALELHHMTRRYLPTLQQWAVFRGEEVKTGGFLPVERFVAREADAPPK
ncbi:MAG: hypothetical protein HRF46_15480 [Acidobacteriota bacterium]|jgi:hypothetical protein